MPRKFEHRLYKVGCGGFAVCTRHTDEFHFFCRLAVIRCRSERQRAPCIVYNDFASLDVFGMLLGDNRRRAVFNRLLNVFVTVGFVASYRHKNVVLRNFS